MALGDSWGAMCWMNMEKTWGAVCKGLQRCQPCRAAGQDSQVQIR